MKKTTVQIEAKAEPEHGPTRALIYKHLVEASDVNYLEAILLFSHSKTVDFITIKSNNGMKFQKMDDARRLLARHYDKYFIVRSPKSGIHFHALARRSGPRTLKVAKGVHLDVKKVGKPEVSLINRERHTTEQPETAVDVIRSLRPIRETTNSTKKADLLREVSNLMLYMLENMFENSVGIFNKYEIFYNNL